MRICEIFHSLQGEGHYSGTPSVFVRLSGCNLRCAFCDTQHEQGVEMTEEQIMYEIGKHPATRHIVITGGEPTLQPLGKLIGLLHKAGKEIQIETNGTRPIANPLTLAQIDWITCSPKFEHNANADVLIERIDELKVVYNANNDMALYAPLDAKGVKIHSLQPCDTGDAQLNHDITAKAIDYCLEHPEWRLSLQTHKMLGMR